MNRSVIRRYPALVYLAGAAALAVLLPSALILPNAGPPTLAEYAPVTGQAQGAGDASALGGAGSGGLGFGGGRNGRSAAGVEDLTANRPDRITRKPGTKRCVGEPPRQTEDPLAPPCIAFFEGDNGGATARGVTRDEVRAVLWWEEQNSRKPGAFVDCSLPPAADDTPEDLACKAYSSFFNDRYQTYGREVRLWALHTPPSGTDRIALIQEQKDPFAIVSAPLTGGWQTARAAAQRGIVGAFYEGAPREEYRERSPNMIGFRPDIEDGAALAAGFICTKLQGRPARYAGPRERVNERKFGFYYGTGAEDLRKESIRRELRQRCDLEVPDEATIGATPAGAARLQEKGVTTVIALGTQANWTTATAFAAQNGWFPEWFLPGDPRIRGADTNSQARFYNQAQWSNAFGLSFDYRRDETADQMWYRAYREGCPTCPEPSGAYGAFFYDTMTMLFYGIQSAGPRLTPANVDRGLHSIPQDRSTSPYKPAAYFEPGNWSFVKDATAIRWDSQGQAPGDPGTGCWRLPTRGSRSRSGEWSPGDEDLTVTGPCQGSTTTG